MEYNYQKLEVYKVAKEMVCIIYDLLKKFPIEEKFSLCDQIRRSAISVTANIAEGMGRISPKEQQHSLEIAYASLMEVQCHLDISTDLHYITQDEYKAVNEYIFRVANMINKLHSLRH